MGKTFNLVSVQVFLDHRLLVLIKGNFFTFQTTTKINLFKISLTRSNDHCLGCTSPDVPTSDEFELKFPELKGCRAELEYFNFRAETELTKILGPNLELNSNSNFVPV